VQFIPAYPTFGGWALPANDVGPSRYWGANDNYARQGWLLRNSSVLALAAAAALAGAAAGAGTLWLQGDAPAASAKPQVPALARGAAWQLKQTFADATSVYRVDEEFAGGNTAPSSPYFGGSHVLDANPYSAPDFVPFFDPATWGAPVQNVITRGRDLRNSYPGPRSGGVWSTLRYQWWTNPLYPAAGDVVSVPGRPATVPVAAPGVGVVIPAVDPLVLPVGVPVPVPVPLPYVSVPGARPLVDPGLPPVEVPVVGPAPVAVASSPTPSPPRGRPPRRTRERKTRPVGKVAALWLWHMVGHVTEGLDALNALWWALPSYDRTGWVGKLVNGRWVGVRVHLDHWPSTPQERAADLYAHFSDVDVNKALYNFARNEVVDRVYGTVGRGVGRASKRDGRPVGYQAGPAL
jgi:hypothetical protein